MGPFRLLIGVMTVLLGTSAAHAAPQQHLAEARTALKDGERRDARLALDAVREAFAATDSIVLNDVLASYWYYRGVHAFQRDREAAAMNALRQALVVDSTFVWDRELVDDLELRKVFEALRGEVESRETRPAKVPERTGCAVAYVDGTRVVAQSKVSIGLRLAQIQCPKGDVYSRWVDFSKDDADEPFAWLTLCPYEVDTSIDATVSSESDDEFGGMGLDFSDAAAEVTSPCDMEAAPPAVAAVETAPEAGVSGDDDEATPSPESEGAESPRQNVFSAQLWPIERMIVTGSGVALMGTSIGMHFGVVVPSFAMVEFGRRNNEWITKNAADVLTERYVQRRMATWAVAGVGGAATAVGLLVLQPKPTSTVQPTIFPGGLGLHGRF